MSGASEPENIKGGAVGMPCGDPKDGGGAPWCVSPLKDIHGNEYETYCEDNLCKYMTTKQCPDLACTKKEWDCQGGVSEYFFPDCPLDASGHQHCQAQAQACCFSDHTPTEDYSLDYGSLCCTGSDQCGNNLACRGGYCGNCPKGGGPCSWTGGSLRGDCCEGYECWGLYGGVCVKQNI